MYKNPRSFLQYIIPPMVIICISLVLSSESQSQTPIQSFPQDEGESSRVLTDIEVSPDGRLVFTSGLTGVNVWEIGVDKHNHILTEHDIRDIAISPDGTRVVGASSTYYPNYIGIALIWDVLTGELLLTLDGHPRTDPRGEGFVSFVDFSPDNQFILTSGTGGIKLWDANDGREIAFISPYSQIAFLPEGGKFLARMEIWDIETRSKILDLQPPAEHGIVWFDISSDSKYLIGGSFYLAPNIWDLQTGKIVYTFSSEYDGIAGLAFSPDRSLLLMTQRDGTTRIWDMNEKRQLSQFNTGLSNDFSQPVRFHPSGTQFLTVGKNATAHLWNLADFIDTSSYVPCFETME